MKADTLAYTTYPTDNLSTGGLQERPAVLKHGVKFTKSVTRGGGVTVIQKMSNGQIIRRGEEILEKTETCSLNDI